MVGKELDHMMQRFPTYRGLIQSLYAGNDDFKAVCDDYWQCSSNIEKIRSEQAYDNRLLSRYHLLQLELESEALKILTTFKQQPSFNA